MGRMARKTKKRQTKNEPLVKLVREAGFRASGDHANRNIREIVLNGWSIVLSLSIHLEDRTNRRHWHASFMLDPPGRGSTEDDWEQLGKLLARIAMLTGYDGDTIPPLFAFDANPPGAPQHFAWHPDGSSCGLIEQVKTMDPNVIRAMMMKKGDA